MMMLLAVLTLQFNILFSQGHILLELQGSETLLIQSAQEVLVVETLGNTYSTLASVSLKLMPFKIPYSTPLKTF